jgi:hypothetical protein
MKISGKLSKLVAFDVIFPSAHTSSIQENIEELPSMRGR